MRLAKACRDLKMARSTVHRWMKVDPDFAREMEEIEHEVHEELRQAMIQRAIEKSDVLAIFFMKAYAPEKYDDNIRKKQFLSEIVDEVTKQIPRATAEVIPKSTQDYKPSNGSHAEAS